MTPETIHSKSISLSVSELRPLLQRLLDCGFTASTSHTLHLTEYTLDPAYQLDINLYPAEEIRRWLDRIDTELNSTYYEANFLRYSSDPLTQERRELDHKRSLLFWTRDYLALSPLATLTAYTEPAGLRLDLVDYYSVYECRLHGKHRYTPLLRPAFIELAAHVSELAHARVACLHSDQPIVEQKVAKDSGHFVHPLEKRRQIVEAYRKARLEGEIQNKNAWAQTNYRITSRTLLNYEREFPEET